MHQSAKILFTSPFTPYHKSDPVDDDTDFFYQKNTIGQKMFTMKQVHHWHALHYIAQNIGVESVVLENPDWVTFRNEMAQGGYEVVAISFTIKSVLKTIAMLEFLREQYPKVETVIGGYGTTMLRDDGLKAERLRELATHVCFGDGVPFFQELCRRKWSVLAPEGIEQQFIPSMLAFRYSEIPIHRNVSYLYSLGCNNRCSFCATTHQYGCKKIRILTPERLHELLHRRLLEDHTLKSGIIYDEDFLENREEFLRHIQLVANDELLTERRFTFFIFASVRSLEQYSVAELVKGRIGTVFIGVESLVDSTLRAEALSKRGKRNPATLFDELHAAGINTIGSYIVGWDSQHPETIGKELSAYVDLQPSLTQIIPLMAFPGTALWRQMRQEGRVDRDYDFDHQVFGHSSVRYAHFTQDEVKQWVTWTGLEVIDRTGPWVYKFAVNYFRGWLQFRDSNDPFLRRQSVNYKELCLELLPLALASVLFFRGKGFRERWKQQWSLFRGHRPIRVWPAFALGAGVSVALMVYFAVQSIRYGISKNGEQPRFRRYTYAGRST